MLDQAPDPRPEPGRGQHQNPILVWGTRQCQAPGTQSQCTGVRGDSAGSLGPNLGVLGQEGVVPDPQGPIRVGWCSAGQPTETSVPAPRVQTWNAGFDRAQEPVLPYLCSPWGQKVEHHWYSGMKLL